LRALQARKIMQRGFLLLFWLLFWLAAPALGRAEILTGDQGSRLNAAIISNFDAPWAMSFINSDELLVTTKPGQLWLVSRTGERQAVGGLPQIVTGGQGGLGDIVPHPDFASNQLVYLSFVASGDGGRTRFARVIRARLDRQGRPRLTGHQIIWDQQPALSGKGHFSHRIVFGPKGSPWPGSLFITSGDRQELAPAQDWQSGLGKIIRLNEDGSLPADNPFQDKGAVAKTFWSLGHRNALGIAFDRSGQLWATEMGPRHGDELNRIEAGANYGWPLVSEGSHYSGRKIPPHSSRPDLTAPAAYWVPTIAPSGLIFYAGDQFPQWAGNAFIGGLRSRALIRIAFQNGQPVEAERFGWGQRVREVEDGPDGALWVLEDGPAGRLLRLTAG
jgi:glucose/arabinose dehydrogenase